MPNNTIPDWKKAAIVAMSDIYGYRAIATRMDVSAKTVKKYVELAEHDEPISMSGKNMEVTA